MNLQKVIDIDYERCLRGLKNNAIRIVIALILGMLVGVVVFAVTGDRDDKYTASASVYSLAYGSYEDSANGISAIRTYSYIIKSYRIAERAALLMNDDAITTEEIYQMINTEEQVIQGTTYVYENQSSVIAIYAESSNMEDAVKVVNAVADAFTIEVNRISGMDFAHVLDYAGSAEKSYNATSSLLQYTCIGGIFAAMLYVISILAKIIFSDKIVSVKDAGLYGQLEVIGVIPQFCPEDFTEKDMRK